MALISSPSARLPLQHATSAMTPARPVASAAKAFRTSFSPNLISFNGLRRLAVSGGSGCSPNGLQRAVERRAVEASVSARETTDASASTADATGLGKAIREDFPILHQEVPGGQPLVYIDSAATSQKPLQVINAMDDYYRRYNANVHRGVHYLSMLATEEYEKAREKVARFINTAQGPSEIVFTRNASEAINLVAYSWGLSNLAPGDEVLLTVAEHHSNIVPWQIVAQKTGAVLKFAPLKVPEEAEREGHAEGAEVDYERLLEMIGGRTKLVAVHHVSNVLGSESPVGQIRERAHAVGAKVLLDACQSVPHMPVDVQQLGVDFAAVSSHKMAGPTGIGFLYGRSDVLASMPPFMGGGEMIQDVFLDHSTYSDPPARFEAGTPAIAEAIGLGAAVDYLTAKGMDNVHAYEMHLSEYLYKQLSAVDRVRIYGPPPPSLLPGGPTAIQRGRVAALCTFSVDGMHATDVSSFLDQQHGVGIRSGHHCAQPIHQQLGINASARASAYIYNTKEEIDAFIAGLKDTIDFFVNFS
ncbi:unnamed protein product [Closterium sp. Yama58-4]|nr:unnamed protein product [Closterium sp. Yama58-4]